MTDPEAEEWDIDVVVGDGRVEDVDNRIRPSLPAEFLEFIVDDVSDDRANTVLTSVADRTNAGIDRESADT